MRPTAKDANTPQFDVAAAVEGLDALCALSGVDGVLFSPAADDSKPNRISMHYCTQGCERSCPRCKVDAGKPQWNLECRKVHLSAGMLADRHGGKYVYVCPEEKVFIAAPVIRKRSIAAIMALGPADVTEEDEEPFSYPGYEPFKQRNSETFRQLTLMLAALASSCCDGNQTYLRRVGADGRRNSADVAKSIRNGRLPHMREYPIESEAQLFRSVRAGDPVNAASALDAIFAYFLSSAADEGEYLDIEHMSELVVTISRAGLDAGVDSNIIFSASEQCKRELNYISTDDQAYRRIKFFIEEVAGYVQALANLNFDDQIYRVQSYVQAHLGEEIRLEEVASEVGFSPAYLSRVFKEKTGMNFVAYVNRVRIDASVVELRATDCSVAQIAKHCGFESTSYFTHVFKKHMGVTPGYYRDHRGQTEGKSASW